MQVNGLNHINIVTADLAGTVEFYESMLGMKAKPLPMTPRPGFDGRWITDNRGDPIIHVQAYNAERHPLRPGDRNGTIDHIALTCADFEGTKARCEELGIPYRINDRQFGDLRQLFITDPNNIDLELNFPGD